jgi:two-component system, chemotaxis family, sensor kinase CheA
MLRSKYVTPCDRSMKKTLGIGKYRDLLFAILLFIILDVGILLFNFFASTQLERDASRINSAGELRMLSQQITKSLLTLQMEKNSQMPIQSSMAQLGQGHAGFVKSLAAIKGSMGQDIEFTTFGLNPDDLRDATRKLEKEWRPLDEAVQPVIAVVEPGVEEVEIAVNKAVARNVRLMALCDDLARGIEAAANTKTTRMRQIQLLAIVLALINFVYIVFKFLRRLNASDQVAEAARRETEDILKTVTEGLLLVRADGTLGGQFSASVPKLFMRKVRPGDDFRSLLEVMLSPERASEARSYLDLMFDPKVKPALLRQLDPLRDVEVSPPAGSRASVKFLSFQMTQVRENGMVKELLVTVFDVTHKVLLERELAATQAAARSDVEDLIRVLEHEPVLLQDFLVGARARLADLNQAMREVGRRPQAYLELVQEAARLVHSIKGEGAALSLMAVSRQAHLMENTLAPLLRRPDLSGEDLIPVVLELSRVQEQVERLYRVFDRMGKLAGADVVEGPRMVEAMIENLHSLAQRVAESLSKEVRLTTHIADASIPLEITHVLRECCPS